MLRGAACSGARTEMGASVVPAAHGARRYGVVVLIGGRHFAWTTC
jgi:hypothetical protein